MSYFDRLSFASGFYHLNTDGTIEIKDNMPYEMRISFWKTWREYRKEIIARQKQGLFSSAYPFIPTVDEDPNLWQYEELLKDDVQTH